MKILLQKAILIAMLSSVQLLSYGQTQKLLSELWTGTGGTGAMFYKNATAIDDSRNVYVAGSTINGANSDVLIQKFNRSGTLLWSQTYTATPLSIPYHAPVELLVGNSINGLSGVYVLSTLYDTVAGDLDLMVKKYNSSGVLQWTYLHNNPSASIDFGTAITTNGTSLFVTGASLNDSTMADFMTISLDESTGALQWETRYDNNNLQEYPAKIIYSSGTVYVTGASQDSLTGLSWSIATVGYNASTGAQISSSRINSNAVSGVDDITDFTVDNQNNLYLVGAKYGSTTNLDVAVYKLDDSLNLVWENFYDFNGLEDKGTGLKVDNSGNIFVTGYSTTSSEGTQVAVLKLDNSGNEVWKTEFGGLASANDKGVNLVVNGEKLFVAASVVDDNNSNYKLYAMDTSGVLFTEATYRGSANLNDIPEGIAIDPDGDIIITGKEQTGAATYVNKTIKYVFDERTITFEVDTNDVPLYAENELIVRFDRSVVNTATVDKRGFVVGYLSDFVDSTAIEAINSKFGVSVDRLKTYKIFQRMTTADSISISRLGDTVRVDDFWATFLITFSGTNNELAIADSLSTLPDSILHYAEPNYVGELFSVPNDNLYLSEQIGLYSPVNGINVEDAWDKQTGRNYVKVGVYDSGINWRHEDFGDGTWNGSKIVGGWDFYNNTHISNQTTPDPDGHGTAVSGIIGALRNNNIGVAGIAGGNVQNGNRGAQLFSMTIPVLGQTNLSTLYSVAASAIVEGSAYNPNTGYGYGFHIQNHSWGAANNSATLSNAVKSCYQNKCIFIAASGNYPSSCQTANCILYPASYNDDWVLKIGANDISGSRASFSVYGNNLDLIAPGTGNIYATLDHDDNSGYTYNGNGTSFATPHASGVVGLLYSEHNVNNGYPNNLAPEDVEVMLQSFATDITNDFDGGSGLPSPNPYAGYGRINANLTLEKLSLPEYFIKHSGGSNSPSQFPAYNQNVVLANNINNIAAGQYIADRYQVTNTFVDIFAPTQTVISHWKRYSSTIGVSASNPITGEPWFDYTPTISMNVASVTTTTFCWWIKTNILGQTINKWVPAAPNQLRTTYSLYVKDNTPLGIEENSSSFDLNIYPNPTEATITIDYSLESPVDSELQITDALGRNIAVHNLGTQTVGNHSLTINVSHLANGMYICTLKIGDNSVSKRIIKN